MGTLNAKEVGPALDADRVLQLAGRIGELAAALPEIEGEDDRDLQLLAIEGHANSIGRAVREVLAARPRSFDGARTRQLLADTAEIDRREAEARLGAPA